MPIDISFLSHFLEEEISTPEDIDIAILFYVSIFPVILFFFVYWCNLLIFSLKKTIEIPSIDFHFSKFLLFFLCFNFILFLIRILSLFLFFFYCIFYVLFLVFFSVRIFSFFFHCFLNH